MTTDEKYEAGAAATGGTVVGLAAVAKAGMGGFGLATGGTAVGVSGLAGAAVLTGGGALVGIGAGYLAYKAGRYGWKKWRNRRERKRGH